ncbi:MAG TPA: hypothetical protein PLY93_12135 [Turneriella sp.]|nr:hypothetical protein [Turneriella sp.]
MYELNEGRLLDFQTALKKQPSICETYNVHSAIERGKALLLEPRNVRHQERVEDLFYLLFKRTSG